MKKRAARLSGETAMRFFRFMGRSSYITSRDVTAALIEAGVIDKPPTSKKDQQAVQDAFNRWRAETGRSLTELQPRAGDERGPIYERM